MRLRRIAVAVVGVAVALGGALFAVQLRRAARTNALTSQLDAASHPLISDCRWDRPVTGGATPRDCNAAVEEHGAVSRLFADMDRDTLLHVDLLQAVGRDQAPTANVAAFIASHGPAMAALHDATLCAWACVRDAQRENFHIGATTLNAVLLLLMSANASPAPVCFSQGLDALRIELDRWTGLTSGTAYSSKVERETVHTIRHVLLRCASRADAATLRNATSDATTIAMTPPPVGDGLATLAWTFAVSLVESTNPERTYGQAMWIQRGAFLDTAGDLVAQIPALRQYVDADWPALFARLSREAPPTRKAPFGDRMTDNGMTTNGILDVEAMLADELRWYGHRDRDLRLLVAALAGMRDRAATGAFPPSGPAELAEPTLRDPLTGEAFGWSTGPDDAEATLLAHAGHGESAEAIALP